MPSMYEEKVLVDVKWEMDVWTDIRKSKINYNSSNSNSNEKKKDVHCEKTSIKVNIYLTKVEIDRYIFIFRNTTMWMELNFCLSLRVSGWCCVLAIGLILNRWSFLNFSSVFVQFCYFKFYQGRIQKFFEGGVLKFFCMDGNFGIFFS